MKLKKVIFNNFKALCNTIIATENKLITLVGENESGKSNALEGISKIDLNNNLDWSATTFYSDEYKNEIKPTLIYEFICNKNELTQLKSIYKNTDKKITIERSQKSEKNDFLLLNPKFIISKISQDNFNEVLDSFKKLLDKIINQKPEEQNTSGDIEETNNITNEEHLNENQDEPQNISEKENITICHNYFNFDYLTTLGNKELSELNKRCKDTLDMTCLNTDIQKHLESILKLPSTRKYIKKEDFLDNILSNELYNEHHNLIKSFLPEIIFFRINASMRDSISIVELFKDTNDKEVKSFQNLIKKVGEVDIPIDEWKLSMKKNNKVAKNKKRKIDLQLIDASDKITKKINEAWKTEDKEDITFKIFFRDGEIELKIEDETLGEYKPSDRSDGFLWYLRFYVDLITEMLDESKNKIILIEEPGVYLHPEAQIDLLDRVFLKLIPDLHQVIYTTHSPFLISNERLNRTVRVAIKLKGSRGAVISGVGGGINSKPIKLLIRKFKYNILDEMIEKHPALVVEGADDKELLSILYYKIYNESINKKLALIPTGGSGEIHKVAPIVKAFTEKIFILVDNDEGGNVAIENLKKVKFQPTCLYSIKDILPKKRTIEDIIPLHIYLEAVNDFYESFKFKNQDFKPIRDDDLLKKGKRIIKGRVEENKILYGILEIIRNYFDEIGYISITKFDDTYKKEEINVIAAEIINDKVDKGSISYILDFFKKIFEQY